MADSIYIRLTNIMDDLARLARHVQPLEIQLALEHIVDRLDGCLEEMSGLTDAIPPDQADTLTRCGDICPVCLKGDCPHWQFLNAEEHR